MLPLPCVLWGSPNKGGQNQNWLPQPSLLGGSKEGRNDSSPLHSWGVLKQKGTKSRVTAKRLPSRGLKRRQKCYLTPAFSGVALTKRDKIRIGCLNPPSRGLKRGRKCYLTVAFSGVPKQIGTK